MVGAALTVFCPIGKWAGEVIGMRMAVLVVGQAAAIRLELLPGQVGQSPPQLVPVNPQHFEHRKLRHEVAGEVPCQPIVCEVESSDVPVLQIAIDQRATAGRERVIVAVRLPVGAASLVVEILPRRALRLRQRNTCGRECDAPTVYIRQLRSRRPHFRNG